MRDGKRKIIAHIAVINTKNLAFEVIANTTVEVGSDSELDDVYNRLELLYSLTREEL